MKCLSAGDIDNDQTGKEKETLLIRRHYFKRRACETCFSSFLTCQLFRHTRTWDGSWKILDCLLRQSSLILLTDFSLTSLSTNFFL